MTGTGDFVSKGKAVYGYGQYVKVFIVLPVFGQSSQVSGNIKCTDNTHFGNYVSQFENVIRLAVGEPFDGKKRPTMGG